MELHFTTLCIMCILWKRDLFLFYSGFSFRILRFEDRILYSFIQMVEELQIVFVFHEVCERPKLLLPSDNWKFSANLDHEHAVADLRHGAHGVHHQLPPPGGQLGDGLGILQAPRDEVVLDRVVNEPSRNFTMIVDGNYGLSLC